MARGFQCDTCGKVYIGEPVREIAGAKFKVEYHADNDICRQCFIKEFTAAIREDTSSRLMMRGKQ